MAYPAGCRGALASASAGSGQAPPGPDLAGLLGGVLASGRRRGAASAEQLEQLLCWNDQQPEGKVGGDFDGATDPYVAAAMIVV